MPGATYLCETDGECPRHGKYIYFCHQCHMEWQADNPHQSKAISEYARGKSSLSTIKAAKKKDQEERLARSTAVQNPVEKDRD